MRTDILMSKILLQPRENEAEPPEFVLADYG
jgi:hypothetical protein